MDQKSTNTYVFHNVDKACVASIEYVIFKYGDNLWFNAALNKVVTDTLIKSYTDLCTIPFIRSENDKTQLSYKGYHYIINQIEKYNNITPFIFTLFAIFRSSFNARMESSFMNLFNKLVYFIITDKNWW